MTSRPLRVFICHSSADKPAVRELYQKLRAEPWIEPWLDEEELFPGMDWNMEIQKAIRETDAILVCLSKGSITKEGYVQREIKTALDYSDEKPEGATYIIPIRLEECKPPDRLSKWQYADYFEGNRERALQRLLISLRRRAENLGLKTEVPPAKTDAEPKPINNKITLSNSMEFMHVPQGKFLMGSDEFEKNEAPKHSKSINYDFWISRFLITNQDYAIYTRTFGFFHPVSGWKNKRDHPVVSVEWKDAYNYCKWLNLYLSDQLPSGLVIRLPTEAEWEKSARGVDGRIYPWGDEFDRNKCNTKESEIRSTTQIGKYSPYGDSIWGCADMAGNVWEWTSSLMNKYPYIDITYDEKTKGYPVVRGGSFALNKMNARTTVRADSRAGKLLNNDIGFRVCLALPLPE